MGVKVSFSNPQRIKLTVIPAPAGWENVGAAEGVNADEVWLFRAPILAWRIATMQREDGELYDNVSSIALNNFDENHEQWVAYSDPHGRLFNYDRDFRDEDDLRVYCRKEKRA